MLETINQTDLHADIQSRLENFIQDHGLGPGDRLPSEHKLSGALRVSRSALREALRSLEALGLIKVEHGRGRFLNEFSLETLGVSLGHLLLVDVSRAAEMLEIRRVLEVGFLPAAARQLQQDDIDALRGIVARMRRKRVDGTTNIDDERAFHSTLFQRIDNELLKELLVIFWNLVDRITARGLLPPSHAGHMVDMHAAVVEHIALGELDDAAGVLSEHFEDLSERLAQASRDLNDARRTV